jgi:sugar O-acyltransferase (sialic acid O-acetyltransferase NeuD family)
MTLPIIVISAGGHARVLISALKVLNKNILGITDRSPDIVGEHIHDIKVLGGDDIIMDYSPDSIELVNGIGSISSTDKRKDIYLQFKKYGYSFANIIHPSAIIMSEVKLGEGVQILAGAIVQTGCVIGNNSIINTGAIVDHDCIIGEHVHVAPGAVLSGGVHIGTMSHIGTSSTVIQGIKIEEWVTIGAGAVVLNDIPKGKTAIGIPARIME